VFFNVGLRPTLVSGAPSGLDAKKPAVESYSAGYSIKMSE
jgi:hypothetical protein